MTLMIRAHLSTGKFTGNKASEERGAFTLVVLIRSDSEEEDKKDFV